LVSAQVVSTGRIPLPRAPCCFMLVEVSSSCVFKWGENCVLPTGQVPIFSVPYCVMHAGIRSNRVLCLHIKSVTSFFFKDCILLCLLCFRWSLLRCACGGQLKCVYKSNYVT
jgi:hypothetical protein